MLKYTNVSNNFDFNIVCPSMISLIYNILTSIFSLIIHVIPFFSKKLQLWKKGQQKVWQQLKNAPKNAIWFHVASAGEFEQAKALIELLHNNREKIIVSFFSPSGYEAQKNNPILDTVIYLPIDSPNNAKKLIQLLQPKACILVKYDFWLNYMKQLNKNNIPIFLISGVFYDNQFLFKWFGKEHLKQIRSFKYISVQDENSKKVLALQNIDCDVTGDTRIDRSLQLPEEKFDNETIEHFTQNNTTTIALGSVWKEDLQIWKDLRNYIKEQNAKLIIAPHELHSEFLEQLKLDFNAQFLSTYDENLNSNVLIIDKIGILKYLYRYADIAYIGGGFGKGIHNTLEPASYAIPVVFGSNYTQFMEAVTMIEQKGAFTIKNTSQLQDVLDYLFIQENQLQAGIQAFNYLKTYQGGSEKAFNAIQKFLS